MPRLAFSLCVIVFLALTLSPSRAIDIRRALSSDRLRSKLETATETGVRGGTLAQSCFKLSTTTCTQTTSPMPDVIDQAGDDCSFKGTSKGIPSPRVKTTPKGTFTIPVTTDCFTVSDSSPYNTKCCCQYVVGKEKKTQMIFTMCDALSSPPSPWKAVSLPIASTYDIAANTITISDPGVSDKTVTASIVIPKGPITLKPEMTEYPLADVIDIFERRLEAISSALPAPQIVHQVALLRKLLDLYRTNSVSDDKLLEAINLCIGNLHAAHETLEFLAKNPDELIPYVTSVGDHFFADSIIGQNYYNAFNFNAQQIRGHSDPHPAVAYVLKHSSALPKSMKELVVRTLTLDMSAWARLHSHRMRFNADITTKDWINLYDHIQDYISKEILLSTSVLYGLVN